MAVRNQHNRTADNKLIIDGRVYALVTMPLSYARTVARKHNASNPKSSDGLEFYVVGKTEGGEWSTVQYDGSMSDQLKHSRFDVVYP